MIILVDQDGVLADFEGRFLELWREWYPDEAYAPNEDRTSFQITDAYPPELKDQVEGVYNSLGFILSLPPIAGAVEAIQEMVALGHTVRICTSPLTRYEDCVLEKYAWVEKYFGIDFVRNLILSKDKTFIRGDILIDDKPEIKGFMTPEWEHVIFDRPYNRHVTDRRRITWSDWQKILKTA